jgi:hypothetical protein
MGKKWSYTCPLNTQGIGRFNSDGSIEASFKSGNYPWNTKRFDPGSLTAEGNELCMPAMFNLDVCFFVTKIDNRSFVGNPSKWWTPSRFKCAFKLVNG